MSAYAERNPYYLHVYNIKLSCVLVDRERYPSLEEARKSAEKIVSSLTRPWCVDVLRNDGVGVELLLQAKKV